MSSLSNRMIFQTRSGDFHQLYHHKTTEGDTSSHDTVLANIRTHIAYEISNLNDKTHLHVYTHSEFNLHVYCTLNTYSIYIRNETKAIYRCIIPISGNILDQRELTHYIKVPRILNVIVPIRCVFVIEIHFNVLNKCHDDLFNQLTTSVIIHKYICYNVYIKHYANLVHILDQGQIDILTLLRSEHITLVHIKVQICVGSYIIYKNNGFNTKMHSCSVIGCRALGISGNRALGNRAPLGNRALRNVRTLHINIEEIRPIDIHSPMRHLAVDLAHRCRSR